MEQLVHDLPSLPEDLVTEILEHLPVKSLLRFKCVSKPWYNLIESPQFVDGHLRKRLRRNGNTVVMLRKWKKQNPRKQQDDRLVLTFHDMDSPQLEVVLPNLKTPIFPKRNQFSYCDLRTHLLGPCEGLLCIVRRGHAFVCNPALRQYRRIPPCPYLTEDCHNPYGKGYFEVVSPDTWGFGTIGTNGFKVVQLDCISREYGDNRERKLLIKPYLYDSVTRSWRQINDSGILLSFDGEPCSELSFNDNCYWHIVPSRYGKLQRPGIILTFEISTETFRQFECPEFLRERQLECPDKMLWEEDEGFSSLMVLNECLAMVWFPYGDFLPVEVWVKKQYGVKESWYKQFVVEKQTMTWPWPIMFWKNDESLLMGKRDGELISYDLRTEETEKFQIHEVQTLFGAAIYKDSLISLK